MSGKARRLVVVVDDNLEMARTIADGLGRARLRRPGGRIGAGGVGPVGQRKRRRHRHGPAHAGRRRPAAVGPFARARSRPSRHRDDRLQRHRQRGPVDPAGRLSLPDEALQAGRAGAVPRSGVRRPEGSARGGRPQEDPAGAIFHRQSHRPQPRHGGAAGPDPAGGRRGRARCWCSGRPGPARGWWRGRSTPTARGPARLSSRSTVRRCRSRCWKASSSATSGARSRARSPSAPDCSRKPTAAPCFSTRSAR